jgi:hypothetical protein
MSEERYQIFKFIVEQALRAPELFPTGSLKVLTKYHPGSLTFTDHQVLVLVSLMFLGLIP